MNHSVEGMPGGMKENVRRRPEPALSLPHPVRYPPGMSTLVVVKKAGVICLGADTALNSNGLQRRAPYAVNQTKIVATADGFIGVSGVIKTAGALRAILAAEPRIKLHSVDQIHAAFNKFRKLLVDEHGLNLGTSESDEYSSIHSNFLVANPHGIFGVGCDGAVAEYSQFWARGSGADLALGSMFSTYGTAAAESIARTALEAAAEFDTATAAPFEFKIIPFREPKPRQKASR